MEPVHVDWFYLSFADEERFLGCCWVDAPDKFLAFIRTYVLGINPGGSSMILGPLRQEDVPSPDLLRRLVSLDELRRNGFAPILSDGTEV